MEHLERTLLQFDPELFILDGDERLKWLTTWRLIIPQLHEDSFTDQRRIAGLIRDVSINQQSIAQAVMEFEAQMDEKLMELHETLDSLRIGDLTEPSRLQLSVKLTEKRKAKEDEDHFETSHTPPLRYTRIAADPADEHLRDWFTTHLAYPFPDKPTKSTLSLTTGLDIRQLNTWFINMRRRSGWTDYLRSYASGNKQRFVEMLLVALRGEGDEKLVEVVQGMKRYVERRPRGKVGDWLLDVSLIME